MPRRKKQEIKLNDINSLEGICQETYSDACLQIMDTQKVINELSIAPNPITVDDVTKIAKEKGGLLKVKDSAIRIKLEIAKLQSDILKNNGNVEEVIAERGDGIVQMDDFKKVREMLKNPKLNEID